MGWVPSAAFWVDMGEQTEEVSNLAHISWCANKSKCNVIKVFPDCCTNEDFAKQGKN